MSAYYPVVLSGASLIVCFWAEVFHLQEIRWDRPRFLSKSFLGFVIFNVISYSLLITELVLVWLGHEHVHFYTHIFNGCYAFLMFVVVIFFLIYGVEVFFKVRKFSLVYIDLCYQLSWKKSHEKWFQKLCSVRRWDSKLSYITAGLIIPISWRYQKFFRIYLNFLSRYIHLRLRNALKYQGCLPRCIIKFTIHFWSKSTIYLASNIVQPLQILSILSLFEC